jgi:DNA repair protein RadC
MTIQDLPQFERPRERLYSLGTASLSLPELLEVILAQGSNKRSVLNLAHSILIKFKSLSELYSASLQDLQSIKGIGYAKAAQIKAALELGKRFTQEENKNTRQGVFNSLQAYKIANSYLKDKNKEHLMLFCLDARLRLVTEPEVVSMGTLDASLIHPREIFDVAIKTHASRIMLAHNHPSGSSLPSDSDIEVTKQVYDAGKIMGIELLDHIVTGSDEYTSIRELHNNIFS